LLAHNIGTINEPAIRNQIAAETNLLAAEIQKGMFGNYFFIFSKRIKNPNFFL
jgi:hypothetical protein